ncbi:active regulator of SIRT1-like [Coccinella septempunctata]|uniref:active regulator of SIRT1-like n=1 Tax=Coccinella septempunctata TaxID=41139 RepID=UPI001D0847E7|nr:active regulator of SIRT1-like [Coccinella septempunctata]
MSSSIVRKALQLVDEDSHPKTKKHKKELKAKDILGGGKLKNVHSTKKLTVTELRKSMKPKEEIYRKNLEKLERIKTITTVQLNEESLNKIIERGVSRRPISGKPKIKNKKEKETVFTEEDFKKFEEEYTGE